MYFRAGQWGGALDRVHTSRLGVGGGFGRAKEGWWGGNEYEYGRRLFLFLAHQGMSKRIEQADCLLFRF